MLKRNWLLSAICLSLSICCFASIGLIHHNYLREFRAAEPYFVSPLTTASNELRVRNDDNAKGHFYAKRDGGRRHKGVDFLTEEGKPVLASRSGRISHAAPGRGYGLYIEIIHPEGYLTRYAHLSAISVRKGEWVEFGHLIGLSGKTGNADDPGIRPHLHYEIRLNNTPLDPARGLLSPDLKIVSNG